MTGPFGGEPPRTWPGTALQKLNWLQWNWSERYDRDSHQFVQGEPYDISVRDGRWLAARAGGSVVLDAGSPEELRELIRVDWHRAGS